MHGQRHINADVERSTSKNERNRTCTSIGAHQEHSSRSDSDALDSAVDSGLKLFLNLGNFVYISTNHTQVSINYRNLYIKYLGNHFINLKVHIKHLLLEYAIYLTFR
jgi:hypothetical protein